MTEVRMDKGRAHSTVHGERGPDDLHALVQFYQDGLPFDAEGILIADHPQLLANKDLVKLRDRLIARAEKNAKKNATKPKSADPSADDDHGDGNDAGDDGEENGVEDGKNVVNLEAWARGEQKYRFELVSQRIAGVYSKRVSNKRDAIETLLDERVVNKAQLGDEFKAYFQ